MEEGFDVPASTDLEAPQHSEREDDVEVKALEDSVTPTGHADRFSLPETFDTPRRNNLYVPRPELESRFDASLRIVVPVRTFLFFMVDPVWASRNLLTTTSMLLLVRAQICTSTESLLMPQMPPHSRQGCGDYLIRHHPVLKTFLLTKFESKSRGD
jgi:hypothetical protein